MVLWRGSATRPVAGCFFGLAAERVFFILKSHGAAAPNPNLLFFDSKEK